MVEIIVPENVYMDENEELAFVYSYIKYWIMNTQNFGENTYISINMLCYYLNINSRRNRERFRKTIEYIYDNQILKCEKINMSEYIFYPLEKEEGFFARVYMEDLFKIFNTTGSSKYIIVKYLCLLMSCRNNKKYYGKVGICTIDYLAERMGVCVQSIIRYNRELLDLKIIFIIKNTYCSDNLKPNMFGHYKHKEYIKKCAIENKYYINNAKTGNWKRSVSARYNAYKENPAAFSNKDVELLYDDCVLYNADAKNKKDLSIFTRQN